MGEGLNFEMSLTRKGRFGQMFAKYLFIDDRRELESLPPGSAFKIKNPSWDQVRASIEEFDVTYVRMIVLGESPPAEEDVYPFGGIGMVIGKAEASAEFTIDIYIPDEEICFSVHDPKRENFPLQEVVIGQGRLAPPSALCSITTTVLAAKCFWATCDRLESVEWIESNL